MDRRSQGVQEGKTNASQRREDLQHLIHIQRGVSMKPKTRKETAEPETARRTTRHLSK